MPRPYICEVGFCNANTYAQNSIGTWLCASHFRSDQARNKSTQCIAPGCLSMALHSSPKNLCKMHLDEFIVSTRGITDPWVLEQIRDRKEPCMRCGHKAGDHMMDEHRECIVQVDVPVGPNCTEQRDCTCQGLKLAKNQLSTPAMERMKKRRAERRGH